MADARAMTFRKMGGTWHLEVEDASGLEAIGRLDPARWAATSAPTGALQADPAFLDFLDPEKKGRIRVSQVVAARDWLFTHLAGRDRIAAKTDAVRLADFDPGEAGARLRVAAEHVLRQVGGKEKGEIRLAEVRSFRGTYAKTLTNGDGVVAPEQIADAPTAALARDLGALVGTAPDASGLAGVGLTQVDRFVEGGRAWLAWRAAGRADGDAGRKLRPLGDGTESGAALVAALAPKIEQYFWQCDLLREDERAAARLRLGEQELAALPVRDPAAIERALAEAPLAPPRATGTLPLAREVNSFYEERLRDLKEKVVEPLFGGDVVELRRPAWSALRATLDPWNAWIAAKPPEPFEKIGEDRLRALLDGPELARLRAAIAEDLAAAGEIARLADLERLILYHRWLVELANNFVNFSAVYDPTIRSLVELGTLVIDGRRLEFVGSSRVDLQACKLEYSIVSPK